LSRVWRRKIEASEGTMKILKTNVAPHEGGTGGCTVEIVYEDGHHVSVNLRDEDAEDFDEQDLIIKAKALLDHADARVSEVICPPMTSRQRNFCPSTKNE
jgi:hypothetical protein